MKIDKLLIKTKKILLTGLAILTCITTTQAQNVNIPNAVFKAALVGDSSINTNGDAHIQVSEASVFSGAINVQGQGIIDLTGIEAFVLLDSLDCSFNYLVNLNVSANIALTYLDCSFNLIGNLNVSANSALSYLDCSNNSYTTSEEGLYGLTNINAYFLYSEDFNWAESYGTISWYRIIPILNFSNNEALTYLNCSNNNLTSINVSANTALTYLNCSNNFNEEDMPLMPTLDSIDVSANIALITFNCSENSLTSLDLTANTALTTLNCSENLLTSLDVSENTALTYLNCSANGLYWLNEYDFLSNGLTSLDVSENTALTYLNCSLNQLTSLNLTGATALNYLNCYYNLLGSIDLTSNTALTFLNCNVNQLTSLNVSANTALTIMGCAYNQLTSLDVSANTALSVLWCFNNLLTCLNVKNGTNLNHGYLYAYNNNLSCIEVDEISWSADNWASMSMAEYVDNYYQGVIYYGLTDPSASFSLYCSSATISYSGSPFCPSDTTAAVNRIGAADGTYTSTNGLTINASTGAINPSTSTAGTYTVTYTFIPLSGSCYATTTITTATTVVSINPVPTASLSYSGSPFCHTLTEGQTVNQTGTTGGTYSASPFGLSLNASTGAITPNTSIAGTYTVTYTICSLEVEASLTITPGPSAVISYSDYQFCQSITTAQSVTQTGESGGTYSSTTGLSINGSTGAINPSTSIAGTYTVTCMIPVFDCPALEVTTSVTIIYGPGVEISYTGSPWCNNLSTVQAVSQIGATGGTYSASPSGLSLNSSTGEITPSTSISGTYLVVYETAADGCFLGIASRSVTIIGLPSATISYAGSPWCTTLPVGQAVTRTGTAGGTYSSTTGLSINANTGAITPSTSTAGTYIVTYTNLELCATGIATTSITINAGPSATISYAGSPFCNNLTTVQAVSHAGSTGGVYSASPNGLSINASTGAINPYLSSVGMYAVYYTMAESNTCANVTSVTNVTVASVPIQPIISYVGSPYCKSHTYKIVTQTGTGGGYYTASPDFVCSCSGLSINSSTGAINPNSSTAGTYTVTYNIPPGSGCAAISATTSVTITDVPSASISYTGSPWCNNLSTVQTVSQTGTVGGTYSSSIGLSINSSTGAITPSTSTAGTYTVSYNITASGGCMEFTTTKIVKITAAPTASISYSNSPWCNTLSTGQVVSQTGTTGGTYSASPSGLSINASTGQITPSSSTAGTYTVSYIMAAAGGCAAAVTGALNLTITPSTTNITTTAACGSYVWNGTSYSASGVYTGTTANCVTQSLDLTITPSSTNTTTASAVGTYTWSNNGQTYTSSGVYTGTTVNCVAQALNLTITPFSATLSLQVFLDGYYINGSSPAKMRPARYNNLLESGSTNLGAVTDVDVITVELRSPSNLDVVAYSVSPILQTNGSAQCVFPAGAFGGSYYIVVKHRAAIPLWSANPVTLSASSVFSFANNAVNAYSDGNPLITPMHTITSGLYGEWLGELNDDGYLDSQDYTAYESDTYQSSYLGLYLLDGDLNGDAYVDASDYPVFDYNSRKGSYEQRPY